MDETVHRCRRRGTVRRDTEHGGKPFPVRRALLTRAAVRQDPFRRKESPHGRVLTEPGRDFWRVCSGCTKEARARVESFLRDVLNAEKYELIVMDRPIESEATKIVEELLSRDDPRLSQRLEPLCRAERRRPPPSRATTTSGGISSSAARSRGSGAGTSSGSKKSGAPRQTGAPAAGRPCLAGRVQPTVDPLPPAAALGHAAARRPIPQV